MKSEWPCVTEVLLCPLNSETETYTRVNQRPGYWEFPSLGTVTLKQDVFCVNPQLKSGWLGT